MDIIAKLGLKKKLVLEHMNKVIQALLEKGIVDYSIVHTAILEYFTIADKVSSTLVFAKICWSLRCDHNQKRVICENKNSSYRNTKVTHKFWDNGKGGNWSRTEEHIRSAILFTNSIIIAFLL